MLGFIYVYTNILFPNNIINIQYSTYNTDKFSNIINKNYIEPIYILFIQPTVNLDLTKSVLELELSNYRKHTQFYTIALKKLKPIIRKIIANQIIETNLHFYINPEYEMIIH